MWPLGIGEDEPGKEAQAADATHRRYRPTPPGNAAGSPTATDNREPLYPLKLGDDSGKET